MSERFWNKDTGMFEQPYFTEVVWRSLMTNGKIYHASGTPAYFMTPGSLWNSDMGANRVHSQKLSAEFYRAARKVMGIE